MERNIRRAKNCVLLAFASAAFCASCESSNAEHDAAARDQLPAQPSSDETPIISQDPLQEPLQRAAPLRAIYPGKMQVSMDEEAQSLRVEVTFDRCQRDRFVYDQNTLEIEIDHSSRIVSLEGSVEYVERASISEDACSDPPEPIVLISENAKSEPYLVKNVSAWMGRAGNGLSARVLDLRTEMRRDLDAQGCLSKDGADIGEISGVWFLQSDPSETWSLSGSAASLAPDAVLRTWSGSTMPWIIESEAPYTFDLPGLGSIEFTSPTCATVSKPSSGDVTDLLIRQTPKSQ
ncbi:MAG: hypothetical protein HRT81_08525 [Henriciella sp.]|nr:hypothetical protein [Henriciella sp.]